MTRRAEIRQLPGGERSGDGLLEADDGDALKGQTAP
ncbi:hypothetical protein M271_50255 [Streptomyces rapamycinicus NRRL 5491]|nr:hypothetical protein M271_50255 [Streptomyces rapamycinicus NRRL 5491]